MLQARIERMATYPLNIAYAHGACSQNYTSENHTMYLGGDKGKDTSKKDHFHKCRIEHAHGDNEAHAVADVYRPSLRVRHQENSWLVS